jgi:hypothetical protein
VVLEGDPNQADVYTIMLRVPAHTKIPARSHRDDRVATVISGTWHLGYGEKFDEARLKALPPGSSYTESSKIPTIRAAIRTSPFAICSLLSVVS